MPEQIVKVHKITPSYVSFTDDERFIGEAAKNQATIDPTQTLFDVKRLIGRRFKKIPPSRRRSSFSHSKLWRSQESLFQREGQGRRETVGTRGGVIDGAHQNEGDS